MFLATTALSDFWDRSEKILFLGSWCLRRDRQADWNALTYELMPSPWNDRQRFFDAAHYVDACYERMLIQLSRYLNAVQEVDFSVRYWRILIGPWLLHYLHPLYDRYVHLNEALRTANPLRTITLDPRSFRVPCDTLEAMDLLIEDAYNLQLSSQLLQGMGCDHSTKPFTGGWPEAEERMNWSSRSGARRMLKSGFRWFVQAIQGVNRARLQIILCDMYSPRPAMWSFALRTRFRALPLEIDDQWSFPLPAPSMDERRKGLADLGATDRFERLVWQSLPYNMPILYLEGFHRARAHVRESQAEVPPVIMSGTGWYTHEPFKFLAAEASEQGTRLITMQHGGSYGIARFSAPEHHEVRLADSFMVWGWANETSPRCRNLPNPKLSSLMASRNTRNRAQASETVLFVTTQSPRYLHRFDSTPVAGQWAEYFDWSLRFVAAVSDRVRTHLLFRPFYRDYGWKVRESMADAYPDVRIDGSGSLVTRLKHSRLVVINYRETAFLETLAADIPTVLFWDRDRWEIRSQAEPFFEDLRRVGILWDSPEEAAAKVDAVYDDPSRWWESDSVQQVRESFANRFALGCRDWAKWWMRALTEEVPSHGTAPTRWQAEL